MLAETSRWPKSIPVDLLPPTHRELWVIVEVKALDMQVLFL